MSLYHVVREILPVAPHQITLHAVELIFFGIYMLWIVNSRAGHVDISVKVCSIHQHSDVIRTVRDLVYDDVEMFPRQRFPDTCRVSSLKRNAFYSAAEVIRIPASGRNRYIMTLIKKVIHHMYSEESCSAEY